MDAEPKTRTRNGEPAKLLRLNLFEGTINPMRCKAKDVAKTREEYKAFPSNRFAANFRNTCNDFLIVRELGDEALSAWVEDGQPPLDRPKGK